MEDSVKNTGTERVIGLRMEQVAFHRRRLGKPLVIMAAVIWLALAVGLCMIFFGKKAEEYTTDVTSVSDYHEVYQYYEELLEKQDQYVLAKAGALTALMTGAENTGTMSVDYAFSMTGYTPMNQREKEVGEADYAVTDGRWIYTITTQKTLHTNKIRIFQPNGQKTEEVQTITVPIPKDQEGKTNKLYLSKFSEECKAELYIHGDILVAVEEIQGTFAWDIKTAAYFYDISDIQHPKEIRHTVQNGAYNTLREYDGVLYLVTQRTEVPVTAMKEKNRERYIPGLDGELLGAGNIILPPDSQGNAYTMVSSWKLTGDIPRRDVKAVVGYYSDVYMTDHNLYLSTSLYADQQKKEKTDQMRVVKFQLHRGRLIGDKTVTMPGTITSSFGIQEHKDKLYVVTQILHYTYDDSGYGYLDSTEVCAYAFDEAFRLLSKQTDIARNETIKSVRFLEDTGYVVSYRETDPLISIDFSDPKDLKVLDELKMPGFSSYLHPAGDDLLLGLGETEKGRVKIALYDITDNHKLRIHDEKEITSIDLSSALEDYRKVYVDEERQVIGFGGTYYGDEDETGEEASENNYVLYHYGRDEKLQKIGEYTIKKGLQNFIGLRIGEWFYIIPQGVGQVNDMVAFSYAKAVR